MAHIAKRKVAVKPASWYAGQMKMTLDLPDDLIQEVKLRAVMQHRTVKDLVAELLRLGLSMPALEHEEIPLDGSFVMINQDGLPVIRCGPNAPAAHMTLAELLAIERAAEEEEDLHRAGISL